MRKILTGLASAAFTAWAYLKEILDWFGRGFAVRDIHTHAGGFVESIVEVLLATPPWLPGAAALLLAVAVIGDLLWRNLATPPKPGNSKESYQPTIQAESPVSQDDLISLAEGAKSLYEFARAKGSMLATAAEQMSGSNNGSIVDGTPEDTLDYMANYIGGKVRIFGSRPPSDKRELIEESEIRRGAFERGALILKTSRHVFTDLAVARRDMQSLVSYLESHEI